MKKRLLAFLTLFVMLIESAVALAGESSNSEDTIREYEILKAVGIANFDESVFRIKEGITYGDFLVLVVNSFGHTYSKYSDEVMAVAKEHNLVEADAEPKLDRYIYYKDAEALAKTALMHETYLDKFYISDLANYKDLKKGITNISSNFISCENAMKLIYNMVVTDLYTFEISSDNNINYVLNEGDTLLSRYRDIYITEGIVEENEYTSLYGDGKLISGGIRIGDKIFESEADRSDLIGWNTRLFAREDKYNENYIVYSEKVKNNSIMVESDSVIGWDDNFTHFSFDYNDKKRTISVNKTAKFLYNGKVFSQFTEEILLPEDGAIEFIDNDKDDRYDVVKIIAYEYMLIDSVSVFADTISNVYTYDGALQKAELELDDVTRKTMIVKDGQSISLKEIKSRDTAAVQKSLDGRVMKVEIFSDSVTTVANSVDITNRKVQLEGKTYRISNAAITAIEKKDPKIREISGVYELTYYLAGNVVVGVWGDIPGKANYGYLTKLRYNAEDESYTMRVFDETGVWQELKLAEKIRLNDEEIKKDEDIYSFLCPNDKTRRQLICYSLNSENLVKKLYIAEETDKKGYNGFSNMGEMKYRWRVEGWSLDSEIFVDTKTKIFVIPEDEDNAVPSEYYITSPSSFSTDAEYTFTPYNVDEFGFTDLMVMSLTNEGNTFVMVDHVSTELNSDDDPVKVVYGNVDIYKNFGLQIDNNMTEIGDFFDSKKTYPVNSIKKGDLLMVSMRSDGVINGIKRVYTLTDGKKPRQTQEMYLPINDFSNFAASNLFDVVNRYTAAVVDRVHPSKELIVLNYIYDFGSRTKSLSFSQRTTVTIYDCESNKFIEGSYSDIEKGDYVVTEIYASSARKVIVYKNM